MKVFVRLSRAFSQPCGEAGFFPGRAAFRDDCFFSPAGLAGGFPMPRMNDPTGSPGLFKDEAEGELYLHNIFRNVSPVDPGIISDH
jgi:hypothetical protein